MGRRLGGWLAVVPSPVWAAVVVIAAVVLRIVVVGPPSAGQPPDPSVGQPPGPWFSPTASRGELGLLAAAGAAALLIGFLARAVVGRWRFRYTSEAGRPRPLVKARLVRGLAQLTVDHEDPAKPGVTVQVRRHYDAGIITLAEVA
jgi:hypothetical protein